MNSYDTHTRTPNRVYLTKIDLQRTKKLQEIQIKIEHLYEKTRK